MKIPVIKNLTFTLLILCFTSCATKQITTKERNNNFIADLESFYIDDMHLYANLASNNPKITDFAFDFYPRSNSITIEGRISLDSIYVVLPYEERLKLYDAAQKYIEAYQNNQIKNERPTKKNAFYTSTVSIMWGVLGLSHSLTVKYSTNIEYLEKDKPYFRIKFDATDDYSSNSKSPSFCIYISPTQWQTIFEICNQAALEERCDQILQEADAF